MPRIDAAKKKLFILNFIYYMIIVAIAYVVLKYAISLLAPFVFGFLFACVLQRPIKFMHRKLHLKKGICGVIVALLFYVALGGFIVLLGSELVSAAQSLLLALPSIYDETIEPTMMALFNELENVSVWQKVNLMELLASMETQILDSVGELVKTVSAGAVGFISNTVTALPMTFIKLVLLIISTIFIAVDYDRLVGFCIKQMGTNTRNLFFEVKNYVVGTLFVVIRAYALIMSITFVELSIGLSIIGINNAILIAACIAVFDILPVLGTGGVMIPWSVINLVLGDYRLGLSLLAVYVIVTIVRNIIEPKIVGKQLGLHPVVTLASMFAGAQVLGAIGLFGFPIFLSLLCHLNDKGIIKVFK